MPFLVFFHWSKNHRWKRLLMTMWRRVHYWCGGGGYIDQRGTIPLTDAAWQQFDSLSSFVTLVVSKCEVRVRLAPCLGDFELVLLDISASHLFISVSGLRVTVTILAPCSCSTDVDHFACFVLERSIIFWKNSSTSFRRYRLILSSQRQS